MADRIELAAPKLDMGADYLKIGRVWVVNAMLSVAHHAEGETNLQHLLNDWKPSKSATQRSTGVTGVPRFWIDDVQLQSVAVNYQDHIQGQSWRAGFDGMDISATEVTVGDLARREIEAGAFRLQLHGTEVDPPPGSELDKLARLEDLTLATKAVDLASPEIVVDQLHMAGLNASIQIDAKGVSNLQKLKAGLLGGSRSASDGSSPKKRVARSSDAERALPVIHLDQVRLENGALDYRQSSVDGTAYAFPIKYIRLEAAGLRLFDDLAMAAPASLSLSYKIKQPNTLPDAHYGAVAAMGRLGADVPSLNAQICYTGVKLETLGLLIPTGMRTTLNANGFDARLSLSLDEKAVNLYGTVTSDAGIRYDAIHIQDPLKAPKVEMGPAVAGVFSQVSGDMLNLGKGGLDAGTSVVESGVDVAAKAGSGTWEIGKNIGGNLLTIGTGLFTMDHRKMQKGLLGTTTGTLERTVDSVADTGKAAVGGLEKSVSSLSGDDETARAWDQGIADRHRAAMQQARSALAQMPYPPVTE